MTDMRENDGRDGCSACWSWSKGILGEEPAQVDETATAATWTDTWRYGLSFVFVLGAALFVLWSGWRGGRNWALEFQQLPGPSGTGALRGVPQAKITDLMKTVGQDMLEEPAHELVAVELASAPAC